MNLSSELKKIVGNKNTITIIGVVLCVFILYVGYNARISSKTQLVSVPYCNTTIQPGEQITDADVSYMNVPKNMLNAASYFDNSSQIIGKYAASGCSIVKGSLFYEALISEKSYSSVSILGEVNDNDTIVNYHVNMDSTYANTMMPGDYVNIYVKYNDNGTIKFGKFIGDVKILAIRDSAGLNVFDSTEEARIPYYMMFALPEDIHLLFRKALYLSNHYSIEISLIPRTGKFTAKDEAYVASEELEKFVNDNTVMVSVDEILSSTESETTDNTSNKTTTTTTKSAKN